LDVTNNGQKKVKRGSAEAVNWGKRPSVLISKKKLKNLSTQREEENQGKLLGEKRTKVR